MPSFLVVIVDCLRADLVARPRDAWPNVARLAREGAAFAAAYTTCPTTTPAVAAMLTGRYPSAHGVRALRGSALPDEIPTLPEELTRAGYRTWCSVTGPLLDSVGVFRGFAEAEYRDRPKRSLHGGWGEEIVARVRREAEGDAPYFGVLHIWDMHTPRKYPRELDDRRYGRNAYERALAGVDPWLGRLMEAAGPETVLAVTGDHGENTNLEPRSLRQQGAARHVTSRLPITPWAEKLAVRGARSESKLLHRLAPRYFWNHNQTLREDLVRVPLVFSGPGIAAGVRSTPVSHVDLPPTIMDLAGLPEPLEGWQGVSLAESLRSGAEPPARPIAMEVGVTQGILTVPQHAIRDGDHKLITSLDDEADVADALYDLSADPRERKNLARERPDVVERLRRELRATLAKRAEPAAMAEEDEAVLTERLEELGYL